VLESIDKRWNFYYHKRQSPDIPAFAATCGMTLDPRADRSPQIILRTAAGMTGKLASGKGQ
jgi:hypothetical protein